MNPSRLQYIYCIVYRFILQFGEESAARGSIILLRSWSCSANYEIPVDRLNWRRIQRLLREALEFKGAFNSHANFVGEFCEIEPNPYAPTWCKIQSVFVLQNVYPSNWKAPEGDGACQNFWQTHIKRNEKYLSNKQKVF